MEIFINGYSSILKEIEKDSREELEGYKKEISQKKVDLEKKYESLLSAEKARMDSVTKKVAAANYNRSIAVAKVKFQDELLDKKDELMERIISSVIDELKSMKASEKESFLTKKIGEVLKSTDDDIVEVKIPKGVKVKVPGKIKVSEELDDLGFVLVTDEGAIINHEFSVLLDQKLSDLRRVIANKLF